MILKAICYFGADGRGIEFVMGNENPEIVGLEYTQNDGHLVVTYEDATVRLIKPLAIDVWWEKKAEE